MTEQKESEKDASKLMSRMTSIIAAFIKWNYSRENKSE